MRLIGPVLAVLFALLLSTTTWASCARYEGGDANLQELSVSADLMNFRSDEPKGPHFLTTLGTLRNSGSSCFTNIIVEVKYFDAKGSLVDTITEDLDAVVVPANQEASFRTMASPARRREDYASQTVRVVSARATQPYRATHPNPQGSDKPMDAKIRELLYAFGPVILLLGVWWYFMRQFRGKNSPQQKSLALVERQNTILDRQSEILERIATAAEARPKP